MDKIKEGEKKDQFTREYKRRLKLVLRSKLGSGSYQVWSRDQRVVNRRVKIIGLGHEKNDDN